MSYIGDDYALMLASFFLRKQLLFCLGEELGRNVCVA